MARTGPIHFVGVFLLFAASILLLITTISAPVINHISILKVDLHNSSTVTFGTFGYCILDVASDSNDDNDYCTGRHIGYSPAVVMSHIDGSGFSEAAADTADGLTNAMILHPIACGIAFIAFLLATGAGVIGSLLGALVAALAWIVTIVIMAIDFALFGIIKDHVNDDGALSHAYYSVGMWTCLAAMVCLFFGMFIVLFTCCSAHRQKRRDRSTRYSKTERTTEYSPDGYPTTAAAPRRKRFGIF